MARSSSRSSSSRSAKPARLWRTVGVIVLIGAAYWYQEKYLGGAAAFEKAGQGDLDRGEEIVVETEIPVEEKDTSSLKPKAEAKPVTVSQSKPKTSSKVNGYDRLEGCRIVDHRNNDGDSFWVQHGDRKFELRIYYVDTAEKYLSDRYEDQRRRVAEQARDFGGISVDQTVELGMAAKLYSMRLLEGKTFTVFTKWERVYNGERYYGWVELPGTDGEYLNERLVEKGVGRIHTKGEPSPDGASYRDFKAHLEKLEREAKAADRGAWGLN
ncbi:MAG: hypothetical protein KDN20_03965 [Verrucomicrobiae bacterium]|nr:hypothetical protein [Verrucomicrobiae bacterium]